MANIFGYHTRPFLITHQELRAIRKRGGLTQKTAAKAVGVSHPTYKAWERGAIAAPKAAITVLQVLAARREAIITGKRKDLLDFLGDPFDASMF